MLDPDITAMEQHLKLLFDWTSTYYPFARFEICCLHPDRPPQHARFDCGVDYEAALFYAFKHNDSGYNVYVTANPLKPATDHAASDADVEIALYQFIDADGPVESITTPSFRVTTGTVPAKRQHIYWRRETPITNMAVWRATQNGLADHHQTDRVSNPARLVRLAGSISYPLPRKIARGYVPEVGRITLDHGEDVTALWLTQVIPPPDPGPTEREDDTIYSDGTLPLYVIEAALSAIRPLMGPKNRTVWLDIAQACRDANPASFRLFDDWQRRSDRYDTKDSKGWPRSLRTPSTNSYLSLFKYAKHANPKWWQDDPQVWEWWRLNAALYNNDNGGPNPEPDPPPDPDPVKARFHRYSMTDLLGITLPKWLMRDLLYEQQVAVFYAPSGSYKSFLSLTLCSMLSHGMLWQGRRLKKRRIIYLAGEGFPLFGLRRLAWFKHHCMEPRDDGLEVINGTVNLMDDADVDAFLTSIQDDADIDALVIDTLSTSTVGHDENTSPVMTKAAANVQRIAKTLHCAVIIVHHPGKDVGRGLRGHSALGANIDAVWCGEKIEDGKKLVITTVKQKDGIADQIFCFAVHRVALGVFDDDGIEMTSLVLDVCDTPEHVKEKRNDFSKVASVLKLNEVPAPSITQVVQRLLDNKLFDCGPRAAATRVSKAISTEWTAYELHGQMVAIRRLVGEVNGQAHRIIMQRIEDVDVPHETLNHVVPL